MACEQVVVDISKLTVQHSEREKVFFSCKLNRDRSCFKHTNNQTLEKHLFNFGRTQKSQICPRKEKLSLQRIINELATGYVRVTFADFPCWFRSICIERDRFELFVFYICPIYSKQSKYLGGELSLGDKKKPVCFSFCVKTSSVGVPRYVNQHVFSLPAYLVDNRSAYRSVH